MHLYLGFGRLCVYILLYTGWQSRAALLPVIVATIQFADRYVCVYTQGIRARKRADYSFASLIGSLRIKTQPERGILLLFLLELYLNIRPYRMYSPHPHAQIAAKVLFPSVPSIDERKEPMR